MSLKTQAKQVVDRYGLHRDETNGVWWLLQTSKAVNALGLSDKYCPFRIKTHLMMCTHDIKLDTMLPEMDADLMLFDKLARTSKLLPHLDPLTIHSREPRMIYVEVSNIKEYQLLVKLQNMVNPNVSISTSADLVNNIELITRRLNASNLSSYMIYGFGSEHMRLVDKLLSACMMTKGKLIMAGPRIPLYDVSGTCEKIPFEAALVPMISSISEQKLQAIGAARLKRFMRGQ